MMRTVRFDGCVSGGMNSRVVRPPSHFTFSPPPSLFSMRRYRPLSFRTAGTAAFAGRADRDARWNVMQRAREAARASLSSRIRGEAGSAAASGQVARAGGAMAGGRTMSRGLGTASDRRFQRKVKPSKYLKAVVEKLIAKHSDDKYFSRQNAITTRSATPYGSHVNVFPGPGAGTGPNQVIGLEMVLTQARFHASIRANTNVPVAATATPQVNRPVLVRWAIVTARGGYGLFDSAGTTLVADTFFYHPQGGGASTYDNVYFRNWSPQIYAEQWRAGRNDEPPWVIRKSGSAWLIPATDDIDGTIVLEPTVDRSVISVIAAATTAVETQNIPCSFPHTLDLDIDCSSFYGAGKVRWTSAGDPASSTPETNFPRFVWMGEHSTNMSYSMKCNELYSFKDE